jgi:hypothetical protein
MYHDQMMRVLVDDRRRQLEAAARRRQLEAAARRRPRLRGPGVPLRARATAASTPLRVRGAALLERLTSLDARSVARRWASRSPN